MGIKFTPTVPVLILNDNTSTSGGGGSLTSGSVTSGYIGNYAVNINNLNSGSIDITKLISGLRISGLILSGGLGSGQVGAAHLASGFILPGNNITITPGLSGYSISSIPVTQGVVASLPAAGVAGRLYFPTNGMYVYEDNGVSWTPYGPLTPMTLPPSIGSLTTINQDTSTISSTNGGITISNTNNGAHSYIITALVQSAPATPYTLTLYLKAQGKLSDFPLYGILFRDSSTGRIVTFGIYNATNTQVVYYTDYNTYSATQYNAGSAGMVNFSGVWLRVQDDGVNFSFYYSNDGYNFIQVYTRSRTEFLANPNQVGMFINPINSGASVSATCTSWAIG